MAYIVEVSDAARKALKKIDVRQASIIVAWIDKNLSGCHDPRLHGKRLTSDKKGYWQYRIGAYRLLAVIRDNVVTIEIISIGHRREVYR